MADTVHCADWLYRQYLDFVQESTRWAISLTGWALLADG